MKFLLFLVLFLSSLLFAQNENNETAEIEKEKLLEYVNSVRELENSISKENVCLKK